MPNRLAGSASPYLLQHADNPVDWYPWGEEAFAAARRRDVPILLSVGYSTCHWCHVMAHESFENPAIAGLINESFVAVKLDREERPDVDRVYMAYVQALTGQGGWPLNAWLTPDLKPFYAGTYFPPEDRQGRAGLPTVLRAIARGWREDRAKMVLEADSVVQELDLRSRLAAPEAGHLAGAAGEAFEKGYAYYVRTFDMKHGGFGGAPKFPRPANLAFLLRCAVIQGVESEAGRDAIDMVARTLGAMARGGIHDHVGGGFHRYSVDERWFLPHFEKMLYDQAQVAAVALDAWRATGDERPAWLVRATLDYVLRDMTDPEGGFHAAEDADSPAGPHGSAEGAYYVWTAAELSAALGDDAAFLASHYGTGVGGNVAPESDPHGEFTGRNVLAQARTLQAGARESGMDPQAASDLLVSCHARLLEARGRRVRPHRDDKVVASWNGLMISALARASAAPSEAIADRRGAYLAAALRAAAFVRERLLDLPGGVPRRAWRRGAASGAGFAEDCACLVQAWIDLYEATHDLAWLRRALDLQAAMDASFWDEAGGGYFSSPVGASDLVLRLKEDYDGAEPAASSIAAMNLIRLAGYTGDGAFLDRGRRTLRAFEARWRQAPQALPQMLCALEPAMEPPRHVVITGSPGSPGFRALADAAREKLGPVRAIIALDGSEGSRAWFSERMPWLGAMGAADGPATAFVCEEFVCRAPARTPSELRAAIA